MVQSRAKTVSEYLKSLPEGRRQAVSRVRQIILKNIPSGFKETMGYGMICYVVPLEKYPNTYNKQPLAAVSLASQKNYISLYLVGVYADGEKRFRKEWEKTGKKLDMGKCCVRFKRLEDVPLDLIGKTVSRTSVDDFIRMYEKAKGI